MAGQLAEFAGDEQRQNDDQRKTQADQVQRYRDIQMERTQ